MNKLSKLINEYIDGNVIYWYKIWEEKGKLHIIIDDGCDNYHGGTCDTDIAISYIISKRFGFIKWLVDNDKIKELEEIDYIYGPELVNHQTEIIYTPYSLYESLLMLLAIQDEPIKFLISILK